MLAWRSFRWCQRGKKIAKKEKLIGISCVVNAQFLYNMFGLGAITI